MIVGHQADCRGGLMRKYYLISGVLRIGRVVRIPIEALEARLALVTQALKTLFVKHSWRRAAIWVLIIQMIITELTRMALLEYR